MSIVTCPNCKMRVLPNPDGTCPSCRAMISTSGLENIIDIPSAKTEHASSSSNVQSSQPEPKGMNSSSPATSHAGSDERIILVIHGAVQKFLSAYTIGDIILTDRRFSFVQYQNISNPYAMFGLVGGVITVATENKRIASFHKDADRIRGGLYGVRLDKRMALQGPNIKSTTYTLAAVRQLHALDAVHLSLTTQDGKKYQYLVPAMSPAYQVTINAWPEVETLYDRKSDPDGFYVGSASPRELLLRIAKGDAAATSEVYQLGLKDNYIRVLFVSLRQLNDDERRNVLIRFSSAPDKLRDGLLALADKGSRDSRRTLFIGAFLLLVFVFSVLLAISSPSFGMIFMVVLCLFIGGLALSNGIRTLRFVNELKTHLKDQP